MNYRPDAILSIPTFYALPLCLSYKVKIRKKLKKVSEY